MTATAAAKTAHQSIDIRITPSIYLHSPVFDGYSAPYPPGTGWRARANGTIAGTVKDASGARLPGVTVEVASAALIEKTRSATTDGAGHYKVIQLPPGTYTVTFTLAGFSTSEREAQ
jgi:hypothetical protein